MQRMEWKNKKWKWTWKEWKRKISTDSDSKWRAKGSRIARSSKKKMICLISKKLEKVTNSWQ